MRWRLRFLVNGPLSLGPVVGVNATSKARLNLGRVATAPGGCVAKGRVLQRSSGRSLGNTTACDHGGAPRSQNLPKYRSHVGPPWNIPSARHHAGAVPMDVTHASRSAVNLTHKAPRPRRIHQASINLLSIHGAPGAQQRLPQADVEGWAWQDQFVFCLKSNMTTLGKA